MLFLSCYCSHNVHRILFANEWRKKKYLKIDEQTFTSPIFNFNLIACNERTELKHFNNNLRNFRFFFLFRIFQFSLIQQLQTKWRRQHFADKKRPNKGEEDEKKNNNLSFSTIMKRMYSSDFQCIILLLLEIIYIFFSFAKSKTFYFDCRKMKTTNGVFIV